METPFRSSKGFKLVKAGEEKKVQFKKDEMETCPYKSCGRKFISEQ